MEALLLGLGTGTSCLLYCGPVIVPYLLAEGGSLKKSFLDISLFLGSRFIAYMILAIVASLMGNSLFTTEIYRSILTGAAYIILSTTLIIYSFFRIKHVCKARKYSDILSNIPYKWTQSVPVVAGFVTGLSICPPLLLAFAGAASKQSIQDSMIFFLFFFLGTSVYFFPLAFLGLTQRKNVIHIIGKIAAGLAGVIYFIKGVLLISNIT